VSATSFADRLCEAIRRKGTPAMVGIDPALDIAEFPLEVQTPAGSTTISIWEKFCGRVIEMAAERVAIVKLQMAFFEALGIEGLAGLQRLALKAKSAGLVVVLDGKRNDIGNTAAAYASAYLKSDRAWASDALTVNPYLGEEGLTPFVETAQQNGAGVFVLVRTSNPGAGKLQDAHVDGRPVYSVVADWVREAAERTKGDSKYSPVGAVVGATVPQQLSDLRKQLPSSILLIPGYGAQGGTAKDCAAAFDENGLGAVVNNSRGILYAWKKPEYAGMHWLDASRAALDKMIAEFKTVAPIK
jgi:orotidine-5'-phosphate decarboxylase